MAFENSKNTLASALMHIALFGVNQEVNCVIKKITIRLSITRCLMMCIIP
jgi:hypothetical protein